MRNLSIPLYRLEGLPVLDAEALPGRVRLNIHDSADPGNSEDVGFTITSKHVDRLRAAVAAFNAALADEAIKTAAE